MPTKKSLKKKTADPKTLVKNQDADKMMGAYNKRFWENFDDEAHKAGNPPDSLDYFTNKTGKKMTDAATKSTDSQMGFTQSDIRSKRVKSSGKMRGTSWVKK